MFRKFSLLFVCQWCVKRVLLFNYSLRINNNFLKITIKLKTAVFLSIIYKCSNYVLFISFKKINIKW